MDRMLSHITLTEINDDLIRNIVSIRTSQDLFDDLSSKPEEWALAQQVEDEVKPPFYLSRTPVIHRPFEDAQWFNAIGWPFRNWQASRFSDGSFGVWYGCDTTETSVYETAYHWFNGLLSDAGFDQENVVGERKVYEVNCEAALLDFQPMHTLQPGLMHKTDYRTTQSLGARLHREGHPGLVAKSVRHFSGQNYAIFNPDILSDPRSHCQLTYRLKDRRIVVEKQPDVTWIEIALIED